MQIFVKSIRGETLVLAEAPGSVDGVKARLAELEGVPSQQQRLLYGARELQPGRSLADYHVTPGATLHLTLGLQGGRWNSTDSSPYKLALMYNIDKMICRKCYCQLPARAARCRHAKCYCQLPARAARCRHAKCYCQLPARAARCRHAKCYCQLPARAARCRHAKCYCQLPARAARCRHAKCYCQLPARAARCRHAKCYCQLPARAARCRHRHAKCGRTTDIRPKKKTRYSRNDELPKNLKEWKKYDTKYYNRFGMQ